MNGLNATTAFRQNQRMKTVNRQRRYDELDYVRAIGIYLVVLGHVIRFIFAGNASAARIEDVINSFHMPAFFIAAGMVMGLRYHGKKLQSLSAVTFGAERARRLMIPYVTWSILYMLLSVVANPSAFLSTVGEGLYATITTRGIAPMWFLAALFIGEWIWFAVAKVLSNKTGRAPALGIATLGFVILAFLTWPLYTAIRSENILGQYPVVALFRTIPVVSFIGMGYLMGRRWKKIRALPFRDRGIIALAFSIVFLALNLFLKPSINVHHYTAPNVLILYLTSVTGSLALVFLCSLIPERTSVLSKIGQRSLDIMLIHHILNILCMRFTPVTALAGHTVLSFLIAAAIMAASYGISVILDKTVRRFFPWI